MRDILEEHGLLFLGSRLKRLADRMQADAIEVFEAMELGVQPSQVPLLTALETYGPMTITEAVPALGISQPAVTRIVGGLVELDLVSATRTDGDQRQKNLDLTARGRALVQRIKTTLWPPVGAAADALCAGLDGPFLQQIKALEQRLEDRSLASRIHAARDAPPPAAPPAASRLTILDYTDDLAPAFSEITRDWVEKLFKIEENDRRIIDDPRGTIIDRGGIILFVEAEGLGIVATCALIKIDDGVFELTKMGVREEARGRKVGEALLRAVIARAEAMQMDELFLLTNSKLAPAIHLYEKLGFEHDARIMRDYGSRYARCNVAMRHPLPARTMAAMAEAYSVRPARGAADLAAVAQLFREYGDFIGVDLATQNFDGEVAALPGAYVPPEGELFLAIGPDGTPVGCVALRAFERGARCEVKRFFVRPGVRGAGLGRRLLEALTSFAAAAGYRELVLDTLPTLVAAIALYERNGFVRIPPYWNNLIPGVVYFAKTLA